MDNFEMLVKKYGKYNLKDGTPIALTQDAYVDNLFEGGETIAIYRAHAIDQTGVEYEIRWNIILTEEEQAEQNDESNMCDWDEFEAIKIG